jgi:hypothetical protein
MAAALVTPLTFGTELVTYTMVPLPDMTQSVLTTLASDAAKRIGGKILPSGATGGVVKTAETTTTTSTTSSTTSTSVGGSTTTTTTSGNVTTTVTAPTDISASASTSLAALLASAKSLLSTIQGK